ncbi:MAG: hypothetical protein O8C63_11780, partial [Candidatus Methanoperedens sp.]|nr:hypothetical protein [Candidatus Methanoperedens sp.]
MLTKIIIEGITSVEVPVPDEDSNFPPSSVAVFYNPAMRMNRDVAVAAIACFSKNNPEYTYLFLSQARQRGVRLALVNARLSDKSFRRYVKYRRYLIDILLNIELIAAGSLQDYERFQS